MIGDIGNSLWQIWRKIEPQSHWSFGYFIRVKAWADGKLAAGDDDDRFPVLPQRLVADVRRVLPDDGLIALDNGVYKIWFALNYRAHQPNTVAAGQRPGNHGRRSAFRHGGQSAPPGPRRGGGLRRRGFMMNSQELETAVRLGLNLVTLVLRDNGYGMIKWKQADMGLADFGWITGIPISCATPRATARGTPAGTDRRTGRFAEGMPRRRRGAPDRGPGRLLRKPQVAGRTTRVPAVGKTHPRIPSSPGETLEGRR